MATPKPTKKTIKEPKFHPHYDDQSADIIFASNDGMHFGISLRLLAKSSVFADMKSLSGQTANMTKGQPIELDCGQAVALQFLELVSVHKFEPIIQTLDFDSCKSLFTLVEQYDCSRLHHPIRVQLITTAQSEERSWDLLKLGSLKEDWGVGRYALRQMDAQYVASLIKSVSGFHDLLCELRPEWHLTLCSIILDKTYEHRGYQPTMDWAMLASKFIKPGCVKDTESALREEQHITATKQKAHSRHYNAYA